MKNKIKKNSKVKVISGDHKGKEGVVVEVNVKKSLIKIEGINLVTKHYKARREGEKSEVKVFEHFIHISNVVLVSAL